MFKDPILCNYLLFSMNRQLLIELKRMKDLQHDHLVKSVNYVGGEALSP